MVSRIKKVPFSTCWTLFACTILKLWPQAVSITYCISNYTFCLSGAFSCAVILSLVPRDSDLSPIEKLDKTWQTLSIQSDWAWAIWSKIVCRCCWANQILYVLAGEIDIEQYLRTIVSTKLNWNMIQGFHWTGNVKDHLIQQITCN